MRTCRAMKSRELQKNGNVLQTGKAAEEKAVRAKTKEQETARRIFKGARRNRQGGG